MVQDLFAVIGDPIGHSLSPIMHGKWLKENHLDHHYHAFKVTAPDLKEAVDGFKALGVKGFNVTIPHKLAIMPFLDEIDEEARTLGAVNTVINENGKLIGTNTDGLGFIQSVKEHGFNLFPEKKVLIIGAGGAARAVGLALSKHQKVSVDFTNRSKGKADALAKEVSGYQESRSLSIADAARRLSDYGMIIQATPVGMSGVSDELPISIEALKAGTECVDLIYKPLETRFLAEAKAKGGHTMNGLSMLIHQGAIAFQFWLGIAPDTSGMEAYLTEKLISKP